MLASAMVHARLALDTIRTGRFVIAILGTGVRLPSCVCAEVPPEGCGTAHSSGFAEAVRETLISYSTAGAEG